MEQHRPPYKLRRKRTRESGSALLMAALFSTIMVTLLAGYLRLASTELRISNRSFLFNASFNLAEGGVELAMDALNRSDSTGWTTGTDGSGDTYWARNYGPYDLGSPFEGEINVVIIEPSSDNPVIYSEALTTGSSGATIRKQVKVELVNGFYPFRNGFDSQTDVIFSGADLTLDSYDSSLGGYDSFSNRSSEITLAAPFVDETGNKADIYGYVVTGALPVDVGPGAAGSITDYSSPGAKDASRVTVDYYQVLPNVVAPTFAPRSLPDGSSLLNRFWSGDYAINSDWSSSGPFDIVVVDDTRVVIDGDMELLANASITLNPLNPSVSLEIYVSGDVDLSGDGVFNSSKPENVLIFGTETVPGDQDITILGDGDLSAAIYAPNANVALGDNGRFFGAVSAYEISFLNDTWFSYDTALEDIIIQTAGGYEPTEWIEIGGVAGSAEALNMGDYGL